MRTTVRIDDGLYRRVKARAAVEGRTVAAVLEDAVRIGMTSAAHPDRPAYTVRASGVGGLLPGVDLSTNAAIQELLDNNTTIDHLR